jgi:hypothetical protein
VKPERQVVRITREEVAPRMSGPFHRWWSHLYFIEGVKRPTHSVKTAKKIAKKQGEKKFAGAPFRVVLAWKESA